MRSRSNGGVIGAYALPTQNYANGVFFIHDAAIYNTGNNPIWPLGTGLIYSATGGTITTAVDNPNYKLHSFVGAQSGTTFSIVTGSAYIDILICGSGGGSGGFVYSSTGTSSYIYMGGAGGGGVTLIQNVFVKPGDIFTMNIGPAGSGGVGNSYSGQSGGSAGITSNAGHSYYAYGGQGSRSVYGTSASYSFQSPAGSSYASGYGSMSGKLATYNGYITDGGSPAGNKGSSPATIYANAGAGVTSGTVQAGGGGGAGGAGQSDGTGGAGYTWSRNNVTYGRGGYGAPKYSPYSSPGQGADGNYSTGSSTSGGGRNGNDGAVVFCYRYQ